MNNKSETKKIMKTKTKLKLENSFKTTALTWVDVAQ